MPRYFFNHRTSDGRREVDIEGLRLDSLEDALEQASFAVNGTISLAEEPLQGEFEIEDEGRVLLARVPYAVGAIARKMGVAEQADKLNRAEVPPPGQE